jgi:hypothetical protein
MILAQQSRRSRSLSPKTQLARFVTELFGKSAVGAAFSGSLEIQSPAPVWVIGLQFSGQAFSTVPIPRASSLGAAIVFLSSAMPGGWATTLRLLNNTSSPITGTVDIFDTAGNPITISLNGGQASTFTAPRDSNGQSAFLKKDVANQPVQDFITHENGKLRKITV